MDNNMSRQEIERMLNICYDKIVYKIGDICIAKADKIWYLISLVNGQIIDSNVHAYRTIRQGFTIIDGVLDKDSMAYEYTGSKFIYSILQNKLWDLPYKSEMYIAGHLLVFIDDSNDIADIAVFNSITGNLVDRVKVDRPNRMFKTSSSITKTGKYTELEVKVLHRKEYTETIFPPLKIAVTQPLIWGCLMDYPSEKYYEIYDSIKVEVEYRLKFGKIKFTIARAKELYKE